MFAAALASCNKDEQTVGNYPKDGAVRINTSVADPFTRAGNTTTYNGDNLALFLDYGAGDKYTASNILWNNNGGTWSASTLMLWKNGTAPVNIYAYSPYRDGETDATGVKFSIPADQTAELRLQTSYMITFQALFLRMASTRTVQLTLL